MRGVQAVVMCQVLQAAAGGSADAYLAALCANITRVQLAEVTWLSQWLAGTCAPLEAREGRGAGRRSAVSNQALTNVSKCLVK